MSGAMKAVEDLENLLAHLRPRDWVLVTVDNIRFHRFQLAAFQPVPSIMSFSGKIKVIAEHKEAVAGEQAKKPSSRSGLKLWRR